MKKTKEKQRRIPRQQRSIARYDAVLDAAARVLLRDGYQKLTMSEICLESGQAFATVYQYFSDTDDILQKWLERMMDRLFASLSQSVSEGRVSGISGFIDNLVLQTMMQIELEKPVLACLFGRTPQLLTSGLVDTMEQKTLSWINRSFFDPAQANEPAHKLPDLRFVVRLLIGYNLQAVLAGHSETAVADDARALASLVKYHLFGEQP